MIRKLLFTGILLALAMAILLPAQAFNISAENVSETYIKWNWTATNITGINIDGKLVSSFDPNGTFIILDNLGSNELHKIVVYGDNESGLPDTGTASTYTLFEDNTWGWVLLVLIFFAIGFKLHWVFHFFGSAIALYGLVSWMQEFQIQVYDVWHLPFLIFLALFILGFFFWAFRKKG